MTRSPLKAQNSLVQPACSDDLPARGTFRTPESGLRNALEAGQYRRKVRNDLTSGLRSGVNGTPTFFINGNRHVGGYDYGSLLQASKRASTPAPWLMRSNVVRIMRRFRRPILPIFRPLPGKNWWVTTTRWARRLLSAASWAASWRSGWRSYSPCMISVRSRSRSFWSCAGLSSAASRALSCTGGSTKGTSADWTSYRKQKDC
jgi:hypothetical protein